MPPDVSQSVWIDDCKVSNLGPQRDGLPPFFEIHQGGRVIMRGGWEACLAKVIFRPPAPQMFP